MIAIFMLSIAVAAQAEEAKRIGFINKTSKAPQLECEKDSGAQAAYTCYDHDGNETHITEGKELDLINFEKVCFHHRYDAIILVCFEITATGKKGKSYVCFDASKKLFLFNPEKEWKRLAKSDKVCDEEHDHFDVPRNMTFPNLNFE
ncbi:hypothetical protein VU05_03935 [Desulfobulbus sp. F1]|nr:hypothetical protein [Desulfobulbus sp. F1]